METVSDALKALKRASSQVVAARLESAVKMRSTNCGN